MNKANRILFIILLFTISSLHYHVLGQDQEKLSKEEIASTIDSIKTKLDELYVYPEVARQMGIYLKKGLESFRYHTLNPSSFADQLTIDLQVISNDKHLSVYYDPKEIASENEVISEAERAIRQRVQIEDMQKLKFGFETVKTLEGQIGYLDLRSFMEVEYAAKAAHKAMGRLMNSDAIIIDLRNNRGGSPSMIQLLSSYFFDSEPVHLNTFYFRPSDEYSETWTLPKVPGRQRPDIDLYVLTSSRTFSAAEEFAYNLKHLKRATIVGEVTAGGAHPGSLVTVTDKFRVWIPQGRAINPITHTNWEGTGVKPDIEASADLALIIAQLNALEKLRAKATNSALLESYNMTIHELKRKYDIEQTKYADVLVEAHYEKWNDKYDSFYGGSRLYLQDSSKDNSIDPKVVLGNNHHYVTLPKGSYVVVQFTDNLVIDAPHRADIFIDEIGRTGDRASIYVSSDGSSYELLGIAKGGVTNSMDLASIDFNRVVSHLKIEGLDFKGSSPGFDVARIYGLPHSNIDRFITNNEVDDYLRDPNIYQRKLLLEPIEFEFESYELLPDGMAYLDELSDIIREYPNVKLKIIGHTDNVGSDEFNHQLSKKRAESVYDYLVSKGINYINLVYEGSGSKEPLTHNDSEEGRRRNRRVEMMKLED